MSEERPQPFWDATKRHELVMPRCKTCDQKFLYPREDCPTCLSNNLEWVQVSGKGRLHSFTIIRQPANPVFIEDVPYIYAMVQLDEGPRMISTGVQCDIENAEIDMPLVAVFDDITPEWTLVKFTPA